MAARKRDWPPFWFQPTKYERAERLSGVRVRICQQGVLRRWRKRVDYILVGFLPNGNVVEGQRGYHSHRDMLGCILSRHSQWLVQCE